MKDKIELKYKFLLISFFCLLLTSYTRDSIYPLVVFSILAWIVIPFSKYWNKATILLLLFSVIYSAMMWINGSVVSLFNQVAYITCPVAFFRLGSLVMNMYQTERGRELFFLLVVIFFLTPIIYQTIEDIRIVGIVNPTRHLLNELNNEGMMSATLYGLMSSVGIGSIAALFAKCSNRQIKCGYIVIAILSMLITIHLVNRTGLVILAVCLFVSFVLSSRMKFSKAIPMFIMLSIIVAVLLNTGIISDDIVSAYQYRSDNSASNESAGGRTEFWRASLEQLFVSPMGWKSDYYSHNMWLDIARVAGLFALFPFLYVTITYLRRLYILIKKNHNTSIIIFISINISMLIASFVEPVIDACIIFFSLMMMMWGCTFELSTNRKEIYIQ